MSSDRDPVGAPKGQVLVADRDPLQHRLIDMLFAVDGFDVVGVETGRAALEYLKRSTPVLALLAVDLPDLDGASICSRMKSVARLTEVPVILIAEASQRLGVDENTRAVARDAGAGLLLQKPLGDKNLRERALQLMRSEGGPLPEAKPPRDSVRSTQVLEDALRKMDAEAPPDPGIRIAALEEENRELRARIARLEATADPSRSEDSDEEREKRPGGLFRRRR